MAAAGDVVTVVQACRWAGVSRRSYYYRPTKAKPMTDEHLAARIWCGPVHRWYALAIVMDCHTREALGWRLSHSGNAKAAEAALEEALISRYSALGRARDPITLRSDNGLVFTSRHYTRTVYQYGLKQEFI